jgi:ubiquinone/menaquinone biosynthesis C-methylase UbiE
MLRIIVGMDDTLHPRMHEGSALWARMFPLVYDPFLWLGERTGVRALRSHIVGHARGRTLEIGAGTGLNLPHYPANLDELVLAEPDSQMRSRLESKLTGSDRPVHVVDAGAERLPFADASIDTVVSTFVLCTVEAPDLAMQEIVRVLRPGGHFAFIEHVRSESTRLARWQDRLVEPWRRFGRGCRCNRPTVEVIAASGLALDETHAASWRVMPPIVRPLIAGRAQLGFSGG